MSSRTPPQLPARFSDLATDDRVGAIVRWTTTPGGISASGTAPVAAGSRAGAAATVWLDDTGRIRAAPPTPAQAGCQAAAFATAAAAGACVLVLGLWWIARVRLEVSRGAQWDRAWAEFNARRGHRRA